MASPINENLWPEWSDSDINSEKWEAGARKGDKGKPATPTFFEDPEGRSFLPESLAGACAEWRRIPDIYAAGGGQMIFEETNPAKPLSLIQSNTHILFSPYIRKLIGSIRSLQDYCLETEGLEDWRPWSLIYSMNKSGGKEHKPLVNPSGKYIVKLYWVGRWRKVIVDDSIPCDANGAPILLTSANSNEIWPLILSKGLLKLTQMGLSTKNREIPELSIVTALTGWIHEVVNGSCRSTWALLNQYLPLFPEVMSSASVDEKAKDKKDKKKKDEPAVGAKIKGFCLVELELAEAELHPCQIVKIRDRPLRPPSPPPVIPNWKLIRPRPDVLQQLEDLERRKIPDRWCYVRSAFKVGTCEEDEDKGSVADLTSCKSASTESDWMRIEDITALESSRIHLFHRPNNPSLKVIQETHVTEPDAIVADDVHTKYFFADLNTENREIIVSFQVQNRKLENKSQQQSIKGTKSATSESEERSDSVAEIDQSAINILETELTGATPSTLHIQNYNLKKYFQKTEDVIKNESYSQGSVRFLLPKGRTVLRFQLQAKFSSTFTVIFDAANQDNIHFGSLDRIMPFGARFPYSWKNFGSELLETVHDMIKSLGNREELQAAIRKLHSLTDANEHQADAFKRAFYRLASHILGDTAVPEDLGALRMAFRDFIPSPGPQPYFPNVNNGLTADAKKESILSVSATEMTASVDILAAASMIARLWRGHSARQKYDAMTGNTPGAIRRQEMAKKRFEELYAKFDENTVESLIRLLLEEVGYPNENINALSREGENIYSISTLEGKISPFTDGWAILFRERFEIKYATELFPLFTEYGLDKTIRTRIRLLDESGNSLGQLLRRVKPTKVEPGFYTLVGEVEGEEFDPSKNMRWKLQLVSSVTAPNLIPERESQKEFSIKSEKGPYLPPAPSDFEPGLLFRYMIGVSTPLEASFHLLANNPRAELKLILKDEHGVLNVAGGQHQVLLSSRHLKPPHGTPSIIRSSETISRSNSRIGKSKKSSSSVNSSDTSLDLTRYTLEGHCVGNWNLSDVEEEAVRLLRSQLEHELSVFDSKGLPPMGKNSSSSDVGKHRKGSSATSPESQQTAAWSLKIFLDNELADSIELRPDNKRKEKIRAMKLAWEAAEEGRHQKGYEARRAYLEEVNFNPPKLEDLMSKVERGALIEDPEEAVARFHAARLKEEQWQKQEAEERAAEIKLVKKQYEELAEREKTIFEQIQFSLNAPSNMSM